MVSTFVLYVFAVLLTTAMGVGPSIVIDCCVGAVSCPIEPDYLCQMVEYDQIPCPFCAPV
jgi:hypothetical protein